ncbi:glycine zipper domain-containing protein [Lactiplantibacillus plantarum]|uniref:glycine zipper domain-containing protein n=1 Tax=Lactiplantibacillus plantarum TaxID=1590 RepID=UPI0037095CE8
MVAGAVEVVVDEPLFDEPLPLSTVSSLGVVTGAVVVVPVPPPLTLSPVPGAVVGATVGAVVGAVVGATVGAVVGATVGAVVGAVVVPPFFVYTKVTVLPL